MTAPAKFLFDVDFGTDRARDAAPARPKTSVELAIAEAEARGYRTGYAVGEAEAKADAARRADAALERIAATLAALAGAVNTIEARLEAEAVEVAVAVARKLAPELIAREPFAELAALAADCFNHLVGAPHVVVRVNDALYAAARERLENIARMSSFDGRLVVLAEPEIVPGDCRIEWADGGLARERGKIEATINEAVDRYVAVRRAEASQTGSIRRFEP